MQFFFVFLFPLLINLAQILKPHLLFSHYCLHTEKTIKTQKSIIPF